MQVSRRYEALTMNELEWKYHIILLVDSALCISVLHTILNADQLSDISIAKNYMYM